MAYKVSPTPRLPNVTSDVRRSLEQLMRALFSELTEHANRLNVALTTDGAEPLERPQQLASYTVLTLPSAATYVRGLIYVSNEAGGATVAFSDGTNWRRVQDRNIVS